MDKGAWRATVHEVTESWTQLSAQEHNGTLFFLSLSFFYY